MTLTADKGIGEVDPAAQWGPGQAIWTVEQSEPLQIVVGAERIAGAENGVSVILEARLPAIDETQLGPGQTTGAVEQIPSEH